MNWFFRNIKITRLKLLLARLLYRIVRVFSPGDKIRVSRRGLNFELDLNEGIDLHLYVFGHFQQHIFGNQVFSIPANPVMFDVGANAGYMSLVFLSKYPHAVIHAFEPTAYALKKFQTNLDLNEGFGDRITLNQCFVSSVSKDNPDIQAYSSWPIRSESQKHKIHGGVIKSTTNIPSITLDDYCRENRIRKLDVIKIDTDGHEFEVLKGGEYCIGTLQPQIIFEIGLYVMEEFDLDFDSYLSFFQQLNYEVVTTRGKAVDDKNFLSIIPKYGTVDLIAIPLSGTK